MRPRLVRVRRSSTASIAYDNHIQSKKKQTRCYHFTSTFVASSRWRCCRPALAAQLARAPGCCVLRALCCGVASAPNVPDCLAWAFAALPPPARRTPGSRRWPARIWRSFSRTTAKWRWRASPSAWASTCAWRSASDSSSASPHPGAPALCVCDRVQGFPEKACAAVTCIENRWPIVPVPPICRRWRAKPSAGFRVSLATTFACPW